jgi:uncharacterized protein YoxC
MYVTEQAETCVHISVTGKSLKILLMYVTIFAYLNKNSTTIKNFSNPATYINYQMAVLIHEFRKYIQNFKNPYSYFSILLEEAV